MAPSIGDICRQHLDYMKWADERLLFAAPEHPPAGFAPLRHVYLGELSWIRRLHDEPDVPAASLVTIEDTAALRRLWPDLHRRWLDWAASVTDWTANSRHRSNAGIDYDMPVWKIALHVANHGSYHRGQVAAALRAAGIAPPASDLIAYYRLG